MKNNRGLAIGDRFYVLREGEGVLSSKPPEHKLKLPWFEGRRNGRERKSLAASR